MKRTLLSEQQAHELARAGKLSADDHELRKGFVTETKQIDEEARTVDFVLSNEDVDRMGDVIKVDGWKLQNFKKNPVILWAHDSSMMPVGKASDVRIENGKLKARVEFMGREISGFADAVFRAIKEGFLSAVSVGFLPLKYQFVDDPQRRFGIDFFETELLEASIVPVPALPSALVEGRAFAGEEYEPLRAWARKLLREDHVTPIGSEETRPTAEAVKSYPLTKAQRRLTAIRARF